MIKEKVFIKESLPIKKCDWVRKSNFGLIKSSKGIGIEPAILIISIGVTNSNLIVINGKSYFPIDDLKTFVVISQEEAEELNNQFNSLKVTPALNLTEQLSCFTRGGLNNILTAKQKYKSKKNVVSSLWEMMHKYPDKHFVFYECQYCKSYHIGKEQSEEALQEFEDNEGLELILGLS